MTAIALTFIVNFMLAAVLWLLLGTKFQLAPEAQRNDVLNIASYFLILLPFVGLLVFFGIERL